MTTFDRHPQLQHRVKKVLLKVASVVCVRVASNLSLINPTLSKLPLVQLPLCFAAIQLPLFTCLLRVCHSCHVRSGCHSCQYVACLALVRLLLTVSVSYFSFSFFTLHLRSFSAILPKQFYCASDKNH